MSLEVQTLVCGPLGNNVYIVSEVGSAAALVIDAPIESVGPVTAALVGRGLRLEGIVCTHGHFDHVAEAAELARRMGAPVLAHALDAERLRKPAPPTFFPDMVVEPVEVARELSDGDSVTLGGVQLTVMHTPGHTPGSICLYSAADALLLSGDTLFSGSYGRYDLVGGDPAALRKSLLRLAKLPAETRVLPGHGEATTIGRETWLARPPL